MGYTYIAAPHAGRIQRFYQQHFNPYLNFHRPCGQPEIKTDAKGKQKRVYRHYQTPWESFEKLPEAASYLKPGQRLEALGRIAQAESDTAAARRMQRAKQKLFASFRSANRRAEQQEEGCGNDGRWKTRKTKTRFPFVSHRPWSSAIPTIPQPRRRCPKGAPATQKAGSSMRKCFSSVSFLVYCLTSIP